MKKTAGWWVLSAAVLAAVCASAAEPGGSALDAADALLGEIKQAEAAAAAKAAAARWPKWDGKESVADYARRAGIKDVQMELDLGAGVRMKLTLIPAGKFVMGARADEYAMVDGVRTQVQMHDFWASGYEFPQREVLISQPFYMGIYEVTQEQYLQVMKEIRLYAHKKLQATGKTLPVNCIPWDDAVEFCKRVAELTGRSVALPTEAQWEYACRAGTKTRFWFGDNDREMYRYGNCAYDKNYFERLREFEAATQKAIPGRQGEIAEKEDAEIHDDGFAGLAPVGSFKPNPWGLYDMHGNVAEHCSDWMGTDAVVNRGASYANAGTIDPTGPEKTPALRPIYHVWRGGSYGDVPGVCRSTSRPFHNGDGQGFRVIVALK